MTPLYPHQVDKGKTTFRGLLNNPLPVNNEPMADDAPYREIGERLRRLREAYSDDSQKAWAERHGFAPTQYNNWEKGARRITVDSAEKLADRYELTLDFIYRGKVAGLSENARKAL